MAYDLVVKNGTVVTAQDTFKADIGVKGEKIVVLGEKLKHESARVIDAKGRIVMPGGIDVHVHLQLPFCGTVSSDDFLTGTKAAACGGVTTLIDFAMQGDHDNLMAGVEARMEEAEGKVCVDYSLHSGITGFKRLKNPARELRRMMDFGVPSHKVFMIYESQGWQSDDGDFFQALEAAREIGATIAVHAESEKVMSMLIARHLPNKRKLGAWGHALSRPDFTESEAVHRAIRWSEVTRGHLYVVHLSTGNGAQHFKEAHARGVNAHTETCPQYLLLDDSVFRNKKTGHLYATCPQIKKKADSERLWQGLTDGEICIVATDTCTFNKKQKAMWKGDFTKIPFGMPGTETLVPAIYTHGYRAGRFSLNHLVSLVSTNPAKLMGMYPRKGTIAPGSDADLAIIDPKASRRIDHRHMATNCDWSPYQGWRMWGFPEYTVSRGEVIVEKGKFKGRPGRGKFVKRSGYGWKQMTRPWAVRSCDGTCGKSRASGSVEKLLADVR